MLEQLHWLGHDVLRMDGPSTTYLDPYRPGEGPHPPPADVVLITHENRDRCSPGDVAKIQRDDTAIVTVGAAAAQLRGRIQVVNPGDHITVQGLEIGAAPAYKVDEFRSPGVSHYPQAPGHVGFITTAASPRAYHAGDADAIPETVHLGEIDVALLPVSGGPGMTVEEAVEAARGIHPRVAIPMHVGRTPESLEHARTFQAQAPVEVVILALEQG